MGFKCGIVGLPNVGKSTFFNALTKSQIPAENFPFCTIDPNIGISPVYDFRLYELAKIIKPKKIITTFMEFIDIAGLVKGASQGEGLGNKFLNNIRTVDVIIHVVRCFDHSNIIHINNVVNPQYDIEVVNIELILSDLMVCEKELFRCTQNKKKNILETRIISILERCIHCLQSTKMLTELFLTQEELKLINYLNLITLKPVIYVANILHHNKKNIYLSNLLKFLKSKKLFCLPIDILKTYNNIQKKKEYNDLFKSIDSTQYKLYQIIKLGYDLLNLETFFTVGIKEVRAWTILKGTSSVGAARKIHTDFSRGFIRANVIHYIDFIKYKSKQQAKKFGKLRLEGKKYIVRDGDIIDFLFNV